MKSGSEIEYFHSNIINYRTSGRWKRLQNTVQIALLLLKRLILGGGGSPCHHTRNEKDENHSPFFSVNEHNAQSVSMSTMLKEASYFLSGFHSDKECQNENSSLTLHMHILCNFFILPSWHGYLHGRVDKEVSRVNGYSYSSSICVCLERFQTCQTIPYAHPRAYGISRVCPGTTSFPTAVKIWHFVSHCLGLYLHLQSFC